MTYFVGLDVSLRSVALCVVDTEGAIVFERALDCDVEAVSYTHLTLPTNREV